MKNKGIIMKSVIEDDFIV